MTNESSITKQPTRLFQVSVMVWGPPVMVAASTFKRAAEIALHDRKAPAFGGVLVVDATEQFTSLSAQVRVHTNTMLNAEMEGVVDYDEEHGWMLTDI